MLQALIRVALATAALEPQAAPEVERQLAAVMAPVAANADALEDAGLGGGLARHSSRVAFDAIRKREAATALGEASASAEGPKVTPFSSSPPSFCIPLSSPSRTSSMQACA